eukprot:CAMPEP_0171282368 /NCGR_PEP_ID=MMETSP0790-20130122/66879_1 /TAXON_ID=2925 /ORGANISM="Alexandrium catenella, Strain OF101" /LENGTH=265 /DNA_ID=CAMNT_0011751615 /DNA_START=72 /DNA_END=870 /DNA_ORIENTATION=+
MEVDMHAALTYSPTKPHYADEVAALSDEDCPSAERADSTTQLAETSSRASEPSSEESPHRTARGSMPAADPTERVRSAVERAQAAMQMEVQAQRPQPEVQRKVRRYLKRHGSRSEAASPQSRPPSAAPLHELEADEEEEDSLALQPGASTLAEATSPGVEEDEEVQTEAERVALEFVRVSNLYQILSVPQLRRIYDRGGVELLAQKVPALHKGLLEQEEDLNLLDTPPETPYSSAETSVKADLRVLQGKVQSVPRHQMLGTLGGM